MISTVDRFPKRFAVCLHRLVRWDYIKVTTYTAFNTAVVPERISQKIYTAAGLQKINHLRLVSVQLKIQPGFNLRLDEISDSVALVPGQYHKIVRVAHNPRLSPGPWSVGRIEYLLKPVKVNICQKRRYYASLGCSSIAPLDLLAAGAIVLFDRCFKPHSNQLQHRPIDNPHSQAFHQLIVWD